MKVGGLAQVQGYIVRVGFNFELGIDANFSSVFDLELGTSSKSEIDPSFSSGSELGLGTSSSSSIS